MPSGGARARSGPAPDPNALRRDRDAKDWLTLPAEGRTGPTPEWPLPTLADGELVLWEREWRRPQAVEWERNGQQVEVALMVRAIMRSSAPDAKAADMTAVQRYLDSLGVSMPGLLRNRWKIGDADQPSAVAPSRPSSRDRLKVVPGGGG